MRTGIAANSIQVMVKDRERHATLVARQSRTLLRNLVRGLWDFMATLQLDEAEVDTVVAEIIAFADEAEGQNKVMDEFVPTRPLDRDTLWLKMHIAAAAS